MEKLKKNKGITLIALVIVVIVLLILAGVTVGALTGENRNIIKNNRSKRRKQRSICRRSKEFMGSC